MLAGGETVLVAVSGGADSVALLHLLAGAGARRWRLTLHVLHVDHGLRADSAARRRLRPGARRAARRAGRRATRARSAAGSLEAAARAARYAALEACAARVGADRIAVGHTADDQAETVLMRVLEGAGVRGLAGIPPVRGRIIRPLIELRRAALETRAASARASTWVEDPTNRDPKFLRNRIRHELLPLLAASYNAGRRARARRAWRRLARETVDALDRTAARRARPAGHVWSAGGAHAVALGAWRALPRRGRRRGPAPGRGPPRQPGPAARVGASRAQARRSRVPPPRRPFRLGGVTVEVSGDRVARLGARPLTARAGRARGARCPGASSCRRSVARSRRRLVARRCLRDPARAGPRGLRRRRAAPRRSSSARRRRGERFVRLRRRRATAQDAPDRRQGAALGPRPRAGGRGGGTIVWVGGPAPRRRGAASRADAASAGAGARPAGGARGPPVECGAEPMNSSSSSWSSVACCWPLPAWAQSRPRAAAPSRRSAAAKARSARAVLRAMEDAFSAVADRVTPAVVHVSTVPKRAPAGAPEEPRALPRVLRRRVLRPLLPPAAARGRARHRLGRHGGSKPDTS